MTAAVILLVIRILLALVLYAFLAAILLLLWRDLRRPCSQERPIPDTCIRLGGEGEPARMIRLNAINNIGRAMDNSINIGDATVSAHHARLFYRQGGWWLEDLGSRNGTLVNEVMVKEPARLRPGDEIRLGRVSLTLETGPWEGETKAGPSDAEPER